MRWTELCPECEGTGTVVGPDPGDPENYTTEVACPECWGAGEKDNDETPPADQVVEGVNPR